MAGIWVLCFVLAYFFPVLFPLAKILFFSGLILVVGDFLMLYGNEEGMFASRETPDRFSNGDQNAVYLNLENRYGFPARLSIIDEVPVQFQVRDLNFRVGIQSGEQKTLKYLLRPTQRGEYHFGALNVYVSGPIGLMRRRYRFGKDEMVPTYPSYLQVRQFQFMAISNRLVDLGVKKIRRLGHTTEFEQIKEYVRGDDYRTLNWKATARANKLMVNQYADERSQNVYCLIDKSRSMKMPFKGMTLLDYAINASLVMSYIAMYKKDRAGLITFAEKISNHVVASNRAIQMSRLQETLYNQKTRFPEADYGRLYSMVRNQISHRSLLMLFTNFQSLSAMRRQLPYLKRLSRNHLLIVVFFENTELKELLESTPESTEEVYIKTMGEQFAFEKKQIVRELELNGIISILTPPRFLTVNTINKYLEIKARGMI